MIVQSVAEQRDVYVHCHPLVMAGDITVAWLSFWGLNCTPMGNAGGVVISELQAWLEYIII